MMCERCHNEATVHVTEPSRGERRGLHLCVSCARKAGVTAPEPPPEFSLDAVVESLIVANLGELVGELAELSCPDCGIKFMEFRAGGRLGCPLDYWVFSKGLTPLLQRLSWHDTAHRQDGAAAQGGHGAAPAPHPAARGDRA